jgi:hypothetical protein
VKIAQQAVDLQLGVITRAIEKQSAKHHLNTVVATGIGEKIIARASQNLGMNCICLSEMFGQHISNIFPAFAVARLLEIRLQIGSP